MKFVFVAPRFHTNQYEIVKILQAKGHEVEFHVALIGPTEDHSLLEPVLFPPCLLSRMIIRMFGEGGVNSPRSFPNPLSYFFYLRKSRADFIILREPNRYNAMFAALCARILGVKIFFYTQTRLYKKYSGKRTFITNFLLKMFNAAWFTPLKGDVDKGYVIPDNMYFIPFAVPVSGRKKKINDTPSILMIGKFSTQKRHILLLDALAGLVKKYDVKATLVGECVLDAQKEQFRKVEDHMRSLGLEDRVSLKVNIPFSKMDEIYDSHDIFVLPANRELASISVLESMAHGLPAICSENCGTKYYIKNGFNGFVFKTDDVDDLTDKLDHLLSDMDNLQRMSDTCVKYAEENISGKAYYEHISGVIRDRWGINI